MTGNVTDRPLAVVTGASSGIGHALAEEFGRSGFDLLVAAEDEAITGAAAALSAAGTTAEACRVDLATYEGVERLAETIDASGRPVDALAVNAGVGVSGRFATQTDLDAELNLINLNVASSVHLAKRVLPGMVKRRHGAVLFTSSVAATSPGPFEATYAASKAFLHSFGEALREELKGSGVSVTVLMPGPTDTNFFARAGMQDTRLGRARKDDPARIAREGVAALLAGEDRVVAGSTRNKLQVAASKVTSEPTAARVHGRMSKPRPDSR